MPSLREVPPMSSPSADRNLLFGVLALQLDFVSRDQLVAAMNAWALEKSKPLGRVLRDQGVLAPDTHELLEALVQKHLAQHGDDAVASLAAATSGTSPEELRSLTDPDVR